MFSLSAHPRLLDSKIAIRRIVKLSSAESTEATKMLAEAFYDSPLFRWAFPAQEIRGDIWQTLFSAILDDAVQFGRLEIAYRDKMLGLLIWYPPGSYPLSWFRMLRGLPKYLRITLTSPFGVFKLFRAQTTLNRSRPGSPHCHAYFLGARRGEAIGQTLSRNFLREADAKQWSVYLETQEPRTVALYNRLGFKIMRSDIKTPMGGPLTSNMWRQPAHGSRPEARPSPD